MSKIKKLGIDVIIYKRYVDDITLVLNRITPGWRINKSGDKMIFNKDLVEADMLVEDDIRTMNILLEIANSISELKFTMDCPNLNPNKTVPILDLQFWVENNVIMYKFYKKPMASPFTVLKRSAISDRCKRVTLFQEGIRRLQNTSLNVPQSTIRDIMSEYSNTLRISGYSERFRSNTINGVMERWKTVTKEVEDGKRVLHRSQEQIQEQKSRKDGRTPATWFLKGEFSTTLSLSQ